MTSVPDQSFNQNSGGRTSAAVSVLSGALVWTMIASSFQLFAMAVLTVDLLAEFDMSRAQIGLVGAVNTLVGAITAPISGRVTDRIGARTSVIATLVLSATGMATMAVAPNIWILAASGAVAGLPQGWGNPATNALIAERIGPGRRGTITGIKQSGVQAGIFLAGFTLPTLALWLGWRGATTVYAAAFAVAAVAVGILLPHHRLASPDDPAPSVRPTTRTDARSGAGATVRGQDEGAMDPWILRLAAYGLLMGTVGGATSRFFPLWVNEAIGLSVTTAGLLVAASGLLGIGVRIVAGRVAESRIAPAPLLRILAVVGAAYGLSLVVTPWVGAWLLWPSTLLNAVGVAAWNAVAMLAIIMTVPGHRAGRASGVVVFGFLGGLSLGSPAAGWMIDRAGSYQPVWMVCAVTAVLAAAVVTTGQARESGRNTAS